MNRTQYIKSPAWAKTREWALTFWGNCCSVCSSSDNPEVYHRSQEHLGNERITDLVVLCSACHKKLHDTERRNNKLGAGLARGVLKGG